MNETSKPLSAAKAAKYLGISRNTLQKILERGEIRHATTPGGWHKIPAPELDRWLYGEALK
jgi:excisionase family DNA binding protein